MRLLTTSHSFSPYSLPCPVLSVLDHERDHHSVQRRLISHPLTPHLLTPLTTLHCRTKGTTIQSNEDSYHTLSPYIAPPYPYLITKGTTIQSNEDSHHTLSHHSLHCIVVPKGPPFSPTKTHITPSHTTPSHTTHYIALSYQRDHHSVQRRLISLGRARKNQLSLRRYRYDQILHYPTLHHITLHYPTLHHTTSHYSTLPYITLHYTTLHHTTLHHTTLRTLHYITLHYTTSHYTTLHHTTSHYSTLPYITLHYTTYTTLHHTTLPYTTLHHTTSHYTTVHYPTSH